MTDYISREDALNFEMEIEADQEEIQGITNGMALMSEYIKGLHAADVVEQKHGAWIITGYNWNGYNHFYTAVKRCSRCNYKADNISNFCPNCGARMVTDDV